MLFNVVLTFTKACVVDKSNSRESARRRGAKSREDKQKKDFKRGKSTFIFKRVVFLLVLIQHIGLSEN
jgi:hypothetical protein